MVERVAEIRRPYTCGRTHVRSGVHRADSGDLRAARSGAEVGRGTVSYENVVGLVLAVLIALFLFAALLFPERF
ncbi:potassium-transporting ATPase subunit F [Mycolicibacterium fortuitum]|nr:potassium-transporting ATPase subunit F [Mycolicibacterium fortuitum]